MASKPCIRATLDKLAKNYRIDTGDTDVAGTWIIMLEGLTDKQVNAGYARLVKEHQNTWNLLPGQFNAYAGGGGGNSNPKGLPASCFRLRYDGDERLWAEIVEAHPVSRGQPALRIPGRMEWVMKGMAKPPLTAEERSILLSASGPNTQQIIDIANKQRRAFGWPLLDVQGRTINA